MAVKRPTNQPTNKKEEIVEKLPEIIFLDTIPTPLHLKKISEAKGDLDKDMVDEKVIVFDSNRTIDMGTEREIHIFKKEGSIWELWYKSIGAVLPSDHGGM